MSEELESRLAAVEGLAERVAMARVKDGIATVMLDATGLSAEDRAGLERKVRAATIAMPGVTDTRVAMTAEKMQRTRDRQRQGRGRQVDRLANIAVALARMGKGRADRCRYLRPLPAPDHGQCEPARADRPADRAGADPWRARCFDRPIDRARHGGRLARADDGEALTSLMDGDWGDCELLIVDLPPGTGDVQMSLIQK